MRRSGVKPRVQTREAGSRNTGRQKENTGLTLSARASPRCPPPARSASPALATAPPQASAAETDASREENSAAVCRAGPRAQAPDPPRPVWRPPPRPRGARAPGPPRPASHPSPRGLSFWPAPAPPDLSPRGPSPRRAVSMSGGPPPVQTSASRPAGLLVCGRARPWQPNPALSPQPIGPRARRSSLIGYCPQRCGRVSREREAPGAQKRLHWGVGAAPGCGSGTQSLGLRRKDAFPAGAPTPRRPPPPEKPPPPPSAESALRGLRTPGPPWGLQRGPSSPSPSPARFQSAPCRSPDPCGTPEGPDAARPSSPARTILE